MNSFAVQLALLIQNSDQMQHQQGCPFLVKLIRPKIDKASEIPEMFLTGSCSLFFNFFETGLYVKTHPVSA